MLKALHDNPLLSDDFRPAPLWLDDAPPPPARDAAPLPDAVDVAVIGAGYTGLHAALQTARGGRSTLVLERDAPGAGCSTRNGGQISASVKPSLAALTARFGAERARAMRAEGRAALDWIGDFIAAEGIACGFARTGRFHAAHSPAHYDTLARDAEHAAREEGVAAHAVPRAEQRRELGTDFYHGGVVSPRHASVQPAQYHAGLLARALAAGARVVGHCAATALRQDRDGVTIATPRGAVRARQVIVATNGYTGALTPWLRRRVIPIGSYVIATEPLPRETIDRLFPTQRHASDTRRVVYYYRASPDRRRVVFGGRVAARETDPLRSAAPLHRAMTEVFPDLADARVSHSWTGTVAYTFDTLPHIGAHDGVRFAMGYCGSGVSLSSWLGMRAGQQALGLAEGATPFDAADFPTRRYYTGTPWFLPAAVAGYAALDRFEVWRAGGAK